MRRKEQSVPQRIVSSNQAPIIAPSELHQLSSDVVGSYAEVRFPNNSGQADPYMLTRKLAKSVEENGT